MLGLAALAAACSSSASCTVSSPSDESLSSASLPIVGGTVSDASQDAVVLLVHFDPRVERYTVCSGTMLAPRLVLTARHCVANTDPSMACAASGKALFGGRVEGNYDPTELYVYGGAQRPSLNAIIPEAVRGTSVIDDGSTALCNRDIGLLLLQGPVPGAKIAPVRLDNNGSVGERVAFVGWGSTNDASLPFTRQQRTDGSILGVGPSRQLSLGSAEIMVGEGTCEGDSGSPALSAKGAVIGALSRGGNGTSSADGTSSCLGGRNIYTALAGFKSLILSAYARAGQEPWLEGKPNPTLAETGAACGKSGDCQSNDCDPDLKVCRENCSFAGCPDGFVCGEPDQRHCVLAPPKSGSCAAAGSSGTTEIVIVTVALVALALRRRVRVNEPR